MSRSKSSTAAEERLLPRLAKLENLFDPVDMYGQERFLSPNEMAALHQKVLNAHWPPPEIAQRLRDVKNPIDVFARIEWERDGEQWIEAQARRWNKHHVFVTANDKRLQVGGTWLMPTDVRRRDPARQRDAG